ncbi:DUF7683 domain-containing protein [Stutzerimonas zhaodongensis]|uniref:DUF7683 domain-containing protein n=1 Tax=Stutzerimonas zhaodongensis TaxID=1176257 RepID=UPI0021059559|nr:hypothetical protein [Stutzerimonas zhaodongensis]MCQ2032284.1 hypothetical protein [Stutzerimonas zhaodongensis]
MNYVIEAFDKSREALIFEIKIPDGNFESLKVIMGWSSIEDSYYGYDLDRSQLSKLEALLGREIFDPRYDFQLGCYD